MPEETTRFAMLMSGEAHIVDLSRELKDAVSKGMKIISSSQPVDWMTVYFGGQYYMPGDAKFQKDAAVDQQKVRQALNMAVNRAEILATIFAGKGTLAYVSGWLPISEGWNPEWEKRFEQQWLQSCQSQSALEGGRLPQRVQDEVLSLRQPGRIRGPQVADAMGIYFKTWASMRRSSHRLGQDTRHVPQQDDPVLHLAQYHLVAAGGGLDAYCYYSKGTGHIFEDEFIEKNYLALTQTVNPEEQRLARAVGDHVYDEFADIPSSGSTMRWR